MKAYIQLFEIGNSIRQDFYRKNINPTNGYFNFTINNKKFFSVINIKGKQKVYLKNLDEEILYLTVDFGEVDQYDNPLDTNDELTNFNKQYETLSYVIGSVHEFINDYTRQNSYDLKKLNVKHVYINKIWIGAKQEFDNDKRRLLFYQKIIQTQFKKLDIDLKIKLFGKKMLVHLSKPLILYSDSTAVKKQETFNINDTVIWYGRNSKGTNAKITGIYNQFTLFQYLRSKFEHMSDKTIIRSFLNEVNLKETVYNITPIGEEFGIGYFTNKSGISKY